MEELKEREWRRLIEAIQEGKCILLVGPDASVDPAKPANGSLTNALAHELADELRNDPLIVNPDDLAHVAQIYHQRKRARGDFEEIVEDFYAPYHSQTTDTHRDLAALPFSLCVNTTLDCFLVNALQEAGKSPQRYYYHFRKTGVAHLAAPDAEHPIVYDLFGSRTPPDSMVLTENDRLEFLVNVIKGTPALPSFITSQFGDDNTSFLFLGFGFQHWSVRLLLHVLQAHGHRGRSLALEDPTSFEHSDWPQTATFFQQEHFIEFKRLSGSAFAAKLRERYQAAAPPPGESPAAPQLPEGAPKVFLCHNSPDREHVALVEQRLQELGIDTWRDRQNLRGGDDWDRIIGHVIEKQIDYFLVLQSPNMMGQIESYFHKEITLALKRQAHFAEGFRFVLPAILAPCTGLDKLAAWNATDLTAPQGIQDLAEAISQDWQQRRAKGQSTA